MKKIILTITISLTILSGNAMAIESDNSTKNKPDNSHSNMKMNHQKPTKEIIVDGIKASFFIVDLKHSKKMLDMIKGDNVFSGMMHPYVLSDKDDKCYICDMKLTKTTKKKVKMNEAKNSHHIEVFFTDLKTNEIYKNVKAKVKVIYPDKNSDEYFLKPNYSYYGSDVNFNHNGKHGIITLFKIDGKNRVAKFFFENKTFTDHKH